MGPLPPHVIKYKHSKRTRTELDAERDSLLESLTDGNYQDVMLRIIEIDRLMHDAGYDNG
jgi:hypothetical protein